MTILVGQGSSYEMLQKEAWHSVNPIENPVLSIMITGKPWSRPTRDKPKNAPLNNEDHCRLLEDFRTWRREVDLP